MTLVLEDEKLRVIYKEPGKRCEIREIGTSLKDYQECVHGDIESIPFPGKENVDIILNDIGKLIGMERNVIVPEYEDILVGPIVVIGVDERNCMWKSLPEEEIKDVENYLNHHMIPKEKGRKREERENEMEGR